MIPWHAIARSLFAFCIVASLAVVLGCIAGAVDAWLDGPTIRIRFKKR